MKITVHVATVDEVSAARDAAAPLLQTGDELEIIVGETTARPAEAQPMRQAVGHPAQVK